MQMDTQERYRDDEFRRISDTELQAALHTLTRLMQINLIGFQPMRLFAAEFLTFSFAKSNFLLIILDWNSFVC